MQSLQIALYANEVASNGQKIRGCRKLSFQVLKLKLKLSSAKLYENIPLPFKFVPFQFSEK